MSVYLFMYLPGKLSSRKGFWPKFALKPQNTTTCLDKQGQAGSHVGYR